MKTAIKRLALVCILTSGSALAADIGPSSAPETTALSDSFPGIVSYADRHAGDVAGSSTSAYPSSAGQTIPLSQEFPQMVTHADRHLNDRAQQSASVFPSDGPETTALWDSFPEAAARMGLAKKAPSQQARLGDSAD